MLQVDRSSMIGLSSDVSFTLEHRTDQMNGHRLFESPPPPRIPHSTSLEFEPLRHSAGSRSLHTDNDVILTNDFNHPSFHPPHSRKVTKVAPSEKYTAILN